MKNHYKVLITCLLASIHSYAQQASGMLISTDTLEYKEPLKWQYSAEQSLSNSYVWKGIEFYSGVVVKPSFIARYGNFSVQTWSNMPLMLNANNTYNPDINLFVTYQKVIKPGFSVTPQLTSFFFPSNYKNIFTTLASTAVKYELEPVGIMINPTVDVCGNLGALHIEYGFFKEARINHNLYVDSKLLLGWGNAMFTDYFVPQPEKPEYLKMTRNSTPTSLRNARLELSADYSVSDRVSLKPQFTFFSNFMRAYTNQRSNVLANGALTLAYQLNK